MADYELAIVGAGIVGSTLASLLAPKVKLALIDRDVRGLHGSTGHAPGFVGQLNALAPLTELAQRTVKHYLTIPGGFDVVGGLEIARTTPELMNLAERAALASSHGLEASIIGADTAVELAPAFVDKTQIVRALHFPNDGTANARTLALAGQDAAKAAGATLRDADVTAINRTGDMFTLTTSAGNITATKVAVCTGVWAGQLLPTLDAAAVSVAHPYAYSAPRAERTTKAPFIRWPAAHVYARDHGVRDGIGSYAHDPIHVRSAAMASHATAYGVWHQEFDTVIDRALALLPDDTGASFEPLETPEALKVDQVKAGKVPYAFNGLFTVTPDGMPLVGSLEHGLYAAVGVWVTHAGGSAGVLADIILEDFGRSAAAPAPEACAHGHDHDHGHDHGHGHSHGHDHNESLADQVRKTINASGPEPKDASLEAALRKAIDPKRFAGKEASTLEAAALASYNDIYNKEKA